MAYKFGEMKTGDEEDMENETICKTTRKGNLPIVINKMTDDAFNPLHRVLTVAS